MTCFWDGILHHLKEDDITIGNETFKCGKQKNIGFVKLLKKKIEEIDKENFINQNQDISWNNEKFTKQQIEENLTHLRDYNPKSIYGGYLCSICDPFLILISILFKVNINHNYCGHVMKYTNKNAKRTLNFKSNRGHFWAC